MNKHEVRGGARYFGGKVEKTVGDVVDSRDWQVAGVIDQVAGGSEHVYGRAQSVADDVVDAAPAIADKARASARKAAGRAAEAVRDELKTASGALRGNEWIAGAAMAAAAGYALGWLVYGRRG